MRKMSKRFWRDMKWGESHHVQLLKKYKDMWVAIFQKKVISAGKNLGEVEDQAKKKLKRDDFPVLFVECGAHIYVVKTN